MIEGSPPESGPSLPDSAAPSPGSAASQESAAALPDSAAPSPGSAGSPGSDPSPASAAASPESALSLPWSVAAPPGSAAVPESATPPASGALTPSAASPASTTQSANPIVCPYLGVADDPRTHFVFPTTAHRCFSGSHREGIEVSHQAALCLSGQYLTCRRYVAPAKPVVPTAAAVGLVVLPRSVEASVAHVSSRARWRSASDGRRGPVARPVIILVAALALAIVVTGLLGLGGFLSAGPSRTSDSSPAVGPASPAASRASPSVSSQPAPTTSVPPTSGPTPSPSPRASVRALPTTHIVQRGETLTSIARHYGVTLDALEKANKIKDPSLIVVGQRLIIPAP
jgi:LysM repeat protein